MNLLCGMRFAVCRINDRNFGRAGMEGSDREHLPAITLFQMGSKNMERIAMAPIGQSLHFHLKRIANGFDFGQGFLFLSSLFWTPPTILLKRVGNDYPYKSVRFVAKTQRPL